MKRLSSATVSYCYDASPNGHWEEEGFGLADRTVLWWNPLQPDRFGRSDSSVTLSQRFFKEIVTRPVPVDLRAVRARGRGLILRPSPPHIARACSS